MLQSKSMQRVTFIFRKWRLGLLVLAAVLCLSGSGLMSGDQTERVRLFTREIEFDFIGWTINALRVKWSEFALNTSSFLPVDTQRQVVLEYLDLVVRIQKAEYELDLIYADPNISDPDAASQELRRLLDELQTQREMSSPVAEAVLQDQIASVVDEMGLSLGGQTVPPVLYHSTPLPLALIVSPRDIIRQDEDVSLLPDISVDKRFELEKQVDQALNVSSLVVEVGGIGAYPTMVQQTSSLNWLSEVVAHEWIHNFLTLRPLGVNYLTSPQLRIMNETAAAMAGKEIGLAVLQRYYPELVPPEPAPAQDQDRSTEEEPTEPVFDFRKEMNRTRVRVDELLAQGKIEEAESYMEERRVVFWQNGYRNLRKLNQAYFAFHGAYADTPGGAAGASEDPVGAAVRALRAQSGSLAEFINRISWMVSFEQLQQTVDAAAGGE